MQTDIPVKRLKLLRAADVLPLLGTPDAQVVAVESLELPASATRLDTVLRLLIPSCVQSCNLSTPFASLPFGKLRSRAGFDTPLRGYSGCCISYD